MIALDTNVLVRFLVEDDQAQTRKAKSLVQKAVAQDTPLFISDVVLCETVWVLASCYHVDRKDIVGVLRQLLRARHLKFASVDCLANAVEAFEREPGDFTDYLIREHARTAGYRAVATFDRALLNSEGFVSP